MMEAVVIQNKFEKYSSYKDSKIEWLEKIPVEWDVKKLKYFFSEKSSLFIDGDWIESKDIGGSDIRYLTTGNVGEGEFKDHSPSYISLDTFKKLNCTKVETGDLLISRLNLPIGRTCIVPTLDKECVVSVDVVITRMDSKYSRRFYKYLMNSPKYQEFTHLKARGAIMKRISREILGNFCLPVPTVFEQTAIANFLDDKTTKINTAIAQKEKMIALLQERRQIIIQRAVTKGLDPEVGMKDSGVEWIGAIPAHWEVKRAKYLFFESNERSLAGQEELFSVSHITGVTPREEKNVTMFMAEDYTNSKICRKGDLVFNIMWTWMGALGVSDRLGIVSPSYGVYRQKNAKSFNPLYLEELLKSKRYIEHYNKVSTGLHSSRLRFYSHMFFNMKIGFPSRKEQDAIVDFIRSKSAKIDQAITLQQQQIEKLKEYKAILINDAVTGKIKIV